MRKRLDAFGSAVRADFDPATSDLDFLVELDALPPAQYAEAYCFLKEGLEAVFGRPVDLLTEASLENPHFRDRIARERRTVYAQEGSRQADPRHVSGISITPSESNLPHASAERPIPSR